MVAYLLSFGKFLWKHHREDLREALDDEWRLVKVDAVDPEELNIQLLQNMQDRRSLPDLSLPVYHKIFLKT